MCKSAGGPWLLLCSLLLTCPCTHPSPCQQGEDTDGAVYGVERQSGADDQICQTDSPVFTMGGRRYCFTEQQAAGSVATEVKCRVANPPSSPPSAPPSTSSSNPMSVSQSIYENTLVQETAAAGLNESLGQHRECERECEHCDQLKILFGHTSVWDFYWAKTLCKSSGRPKTYFMFSSNFRQAMYCE